MDFASIVEQLKEERNRLNQAIAALEGTNPSSGRGRRAAGKGRAGRKRRMSAEARRRISTAQKKRWARQKKAQK